MLSLNETSHSMLSWARPSFVLKELHVCQRNPSTPYGISDKLERSLCFVSTGFLGRGGVTFCSLAIPYDVTCMTRDIVRRFPRNSNQFLVQSQRPVCVWRTHKACLHNCIIIPCVSRTTLSSSDRHLPLCPLGKGIPLASNGVQRHRSSWRHTRGGATCPALVRHAYPAQQNGQQVGSRRQPSVLGKVAESRQAEPASRAVQAAPHPRRQTQQATQQGVPDHAGPARRGPPYSHPSSLASAS